MSQSNVANAIIAQLEQSGELARLQRTLEFKATQKWTEDIKKNASKVIQDQGITNITAEEVAKQVASSASRQLEPNVRKDMLDAIHKAIQSELEEM